MKSLKTCALATLMLLAASRFEPSSAQITVEIDNYSRVAADDLYLMLTGDPSKPITVDGITPNVSTPLRGLTDGRFTLGAVSAGRLIFSYGAPVPANQNPTVPSARFDKVEFTYPGYGNLTAVDFFAIPFKLETFNSNGQLLQTLTYYSSERSLAAALETLAPNAEVTTDGTKGGPFARILSPVLLPSAYPDLQPYVTSVAGKTVTISGTYQGNIPPTPNSYDYSGTFGGDGSITLRGTMTQPARPANGPLAINGSSLAFAIYNNNGPYTVDGIPNEVAANDVYAAIYRDLIAGFDFGYVAGIYGNDSAGWYGTTPYHPPYACARATDDGFYNQYASLIAANSDAYGFPFSDRLQPVLIALNPGIATPVATLRITVLPDDMLDAPIIQSSSATDHSLTVSWDAIAGATDYKITVSPPLAGQTFDADTATSYTIAGLNGGTPYTVAVTAVKDSATSEAIPVLISTTGVTTPVSGPVGWHFIAFFTGTFAGDTVTFNGVTRTLPPTQNPSLSWDDNLTGRPGASNAYVFDWKDSQGNEIYKSILYVQLASSPTIGLGKIDEAASATFMAANQALPTYDATGFNLFLGIAPNLQRTLCVAGGG